MINPKVLVVMPAFNAARFLKESIPSILNQKGVGIKLIVIDDCSTDDTYKIAQSYPQVTVIKNKKNMGNYYSVNKVMYEMINTPIDWDYHTYHGADDVSNPDRFIKQIRMFDSSPNSLAIGCRFQRMEFKSRRIKPTNPKTNESMLIFKKEILDLVGFRDSGRAGCDTEFKQRIQLARPGCISSVDEVLLTAYLHDDNLTKRIPIGGTHRRKYVAEFQAKHKKMKQNNNFYQSFKP
jgi:glycosyltransferase involved in cell wall biosynthesis